MDLVMDEKAIAANESPQVLSAQQAMLTQMMAQSMSNSVQPSFNSGVPTLLTPSQMSSFSISPIQPPTTSTSKYAQLLQVIEELGKDIRPTYSGSKSSAERLKRGIIHARILVRECLMETERNNARN